jgi:transcriptional regulator with XRE-family HTH domain
MDSATARLDKLAAFLADHGVSRTEVASALGVDLSTVSRKVGGTRSFRLDEVTKLLGFLTLRLGRRVTFADLFLAANDMVVPSRRRGRAA